MKKQLKKLFKKNRSDDRNLSKKIRNLFGFKPGNIYLYRLAFLHRSAAVEISGGVKLSNERLEYLGDAVLSSIVAEYLYRKFPIKEEGFLTEMRSKLVSRESLNKLANRVGFSSFVIFDKSHSRAPKSMLGDAFEAFIGALFLDKGYTKTRTIVIHRIIEIYFDVDTLVVTPLNHKSELLEKCQHYHWDIQFKSEEQQSNRNTRQFKVDVLINDEWVESAYGFTIKGAEKIAAEKALLVLREREKKHVDGVVSDH